MRYLSFFVLFMYLGGFIKAQKNSKQGHQASVYAIQDSIAILPCNSGGVMEVKWFYFKDKNKLIPVVARDKNGQKIGTKPTKWNRYTDFTGIDANIKIRNVKYRRDHGLFYCIFKSGASIVNLDIIVRLQGVKMYPDLSPWILKTNIPITISCKATLSRPIPYITWHIETQNGTIVKDITVKATTTVEPDVVDKPAILSSYLRNYKADLDLEGNYLVCVARVEGTELNFRERNGPVSVYYPPAELPVFTGYEGYWRTGEIAKLTCSVKNVNPAYNVTFSLECPTYLETEIKHLSTDISPLGGGTGGDVRSYFQIKIKQSLQNKQCICTMYHKPTDTIMMSNDTGSFQLNVPYTPKSVRISQESFTGMDGEVKPSLCIVERSNPPVEPHQLSWSDGCGIDKNDWNFTVNRIGRASLSGLVTLKRTNHRKTCFCFLNYSSKVQLNDSATFDVLYPPLIGPILEGYGTKHILDGIGMTCSVVDVNPISGTTFVLECPDYSVSEITTREIRGSTAAPDRTDGNVTGIFTFFAKKSLNEKQCTCICIHTPTQYNEKSTGDGRFNITYPPTSLTMSPTYINSTLGSKHSVYCTADGANPPLTVSQFIWTDDCGEDATHSKLEQPSNDAVRVMRTIQLREEQNGKNCTCVLRYSSDTELRTNVMMNVLYTPTQVTLDQDSFTSSAGKLTTLTCYVDSANPPTSHSQFVWSRDCGHQIGDSVYKVNADLSASITRKINVSREDDGKNCTCVVMYSPSHTLTASGVFNISFAPVIKDIESNKQRVYVSQWMNLTLTCEVWAKPKPMIEWVMDGDVITGSTVHSLTDNRYESILKLYNISRGQSGQYHCEADNGMAPRDTIFYDVIVKYVPVITDTSIPLDLFIDEGNAVQLWCQVLAYPQPQISWKACCDVLNTTQHSVIGKHEYQSTLNMLKVNRKDTGVYSCETRNDVGAGDAADFHVTVSYAPSIENTSNTNVEIEEGDNFELTCEVSAYPQPSIVWIYHNSTVNGAKFTKTTDRRHKSTLSVTGSNRNQTGQYRCVATNRIGTAEALFDVNIVYPPVMEETSTAKLNVSEGDNFTLTCTASSNPQPNITWLHEDTVIQRTVHKMMNDSRYLSALTVTGARRSDAGQYRCVVNNGVGRPREAHFDINILYGPTIEDPHKPTDVNVTEDEDFKLICVVTSNPQPNVKWFHGNILVQSSLGKSIGNHRYVSTLAVTDTRRNQTGQYRCVADNGVDVSDTGHFTVIVFCEFTMI